VPIGALTISATNIYISNYFVFLSNYRSFSSNMQIVLLTCFLAVKGIDVTALESLVKSCELGGIPTSFGV